jgi:transcription antitermination factor NusB
MTDNAKKSGFRGRSFARMIAFQIICGHEYNPGGLTPLDDDYIRTKFRELETGGKSEGDDDALLADDALPKGKISEREAALWADFARRLIHTALAKRAEIDRRLTAASQNWRLERMSLTDRNILRMAVAEIDLGTPEAVVINEAIELGKKFGRDAESPKFINGVLGKVIRGKTYPTDASCESQDI